MGFLPIKSDIFPKITPDNIPPIDDRDISNPISDVLRPCELKYIGKKDRVVPPLIEAIHITIDSLKKSCWFLINPITFRYKFAKFLLHYIHFLWNIRLKDKDIGRIHVLRIALM